MTHKKFPFLYCAHTYLYIVWIPCLFYIYIWFCCCCCCSFVCIYSMSLFTRVLCRYCCCLIKFTVCSRHFISKKQKKHFFLTPRKPLASLFTNSQPPARTHTHTTEWRALSESHITIANNIHSECVYLWVCSRTKRKWVKYIRTNGTNITMFANSVIYSSSLVPGGSGERERREKSVCIFCCCCCRPHRHSTDFHFQPLTPDAHQQITERIFHFCCLCP